MRAPYPNPYYPLPQMLELRDNYAQMTPERSAALKLYVALSAPDRRAAANLIDLENNDWLHIYPPSEKTEISTEKAIDTFLELYGSSSDDKETALLERLIFNPTPDYASVLAKDTAPTAPGDEQDSMIDAFIAAHNSEPTTAPASEPRTSPETEPEKEQEQAPEPKTEPEPQPSPAPAPVKPRINKDETLTENLARIFIRKGRYQQALDILLELRRTRPDRAALYASHIRFLEKLVALQP